MVGEVSVHDDHKVAFRELEAVDVGCPETQLARARLEDDTVGAVDLDELLCDLLGPVRGSVVDYNELPFQLAVARPTLVSYAASGR